MDLNQPSKNNPRWIGVVLALLIPGSAHYLSGSKKAGFAWFFSFWILTAIGVSLAAVPTKASIVSGLALLLITATVLRIALLARSFRATRRLSAKGWITFAVAFIAINLLEIPVKMMSPVVPYKIPTNAMAPTLRGTQTTPEQTPDEFLSWVLKGRTFKEFRATASGAVSNPRMTGDKLRLTIGNEPHELPTYVTQEFRPKPHYNNGDVIWSGTVHANDHILASRTAYLFAAPKRGDIITFKTEDIEHPSVKSNTIYLKRIVGLPGETVGIKNGEVVINGTPLSSPDRAYRNEGKLEGPDDTITLGDDEYLVLGDNTSPNGSLDGRYFGGISRNSIIAKVTSIYWPLHRIGPVE